MTLYDVTFFALGAKHTWGFYANSKEQAEEKLLEHLDYAMGLRPKNIIVVKVEKRPNWICALWNRVLQSFCK